MKNILFLCTGNSARSVMAEAYANYAGAGRWRAYSAGSQPTGKVNPFALATLRWADIPAGEPSSKSWDVFAGDDAPKMDLIVTVCDSAAGETCPIWPGAPRMEHWGFPDPAAAEGSDEEKLAVFQRIFQAIRSRIDRFLLEEDA